MLWTAAIVAGPGSRFALARVANLSVTAPQRALPVVPSSLSYPFPWTILRLKSEGTGIHSASLKKNGSAKSMQPIFGFSIGSMGTRLYFAILSRSEEHTSELQSQSNLVCRLLLEKKKIIHNYIYFVGYLCMLTRFCSSLDSHILF